MLAACTALVWSGGHPGYAVGAVVLSLLDVVLFSTLVTSEWVRQAAEVYAHRLLEATESMASAIQA